MTVTIQKSVEVGGVLTDATTFKLQSADGTYGVKRHDTGDVVVASGTDMTHASTGVYTYDIPSPVAGVQYDYAITATVSGKTIQFEGSITAPAASVSDDMTVADARDVVRQFARNAGDSTAYTDAEIDRAIQAVGEDFARFTRCVRQTDTVSLSANSSAADLSGIDSFRPQRVLRTWIDGVGDLSVTDATTIASDAANHPCTAAPKYIGFTDWSTAAVYPTPDQAYTLNVQWFAPFTVWTPGAAGTDTTTLNIPRDWLIRILIDGATAMLQHTEPENAYATDAWQRYLAFRAECRGAAGNGAKVIYRQVCD